jgi:16S rRNA (guanine966-N2)-methyltransferase
MRVIAGRLGSRKLHAPPGDQTRPTHDRVKEALFSVLGDIRNKNVVDLYAGTGALGIEALSRGAAHACFVERSRAALFCLRRNLHELNLVDVSTVVARSVESVSPELSRLGPHDLVFCDPPWSDIVNVMTVLGKLAPKRWLAADGCLILEHAAKFAPAPLSIPGLVATDQRRWGDTAVTFFVAASLGEGDDDPCRS